LQTLGGPGESALLHNLREHRERLEAIHAS